MKRISDEQYANLFFPERGVNDSLSDLPPGFTEVGTNVRVYEALTGRGRGGSRSGLRKFVPSQVSGFHEIQHLATIVSVDASLVGWSGDDGDQGFPGHYGGIGFIDPVGGGGFGDPGSPGGIDPFPAQWLSGTGGGGYQPNGTETRLIKVGARVVRASTTVRLAMSEDRVVRVVAPAGHPAGITVYARITNQDGRSPNDYLGFESVTLYTDPPGEVGDAQPVSMEFDLTDPPAGRLGLGEYEVYSLVPAIITYYAISYAIAGARYRSRIPVQIRFAPYDLVGAVADASINPGDTGTFTATLTDYLGAVVPGKVIRLQTRDTDTGAPASNNGDTATTNGSGVATFPVSEASPRTVGYKGFMVEDSPDIYSDEKFITYGQLGMWDYRFDGNLADHFGVGPDMVGSGTLSGSAYVFTAGDGLTLTNVGLSDLGIWTIEMLFSIDFVPALDLTTAMYNIINFYEADPALLGGPRGLYVTKIASIGNATPLLNLLENAPTAGPDEALIIAADTVYCVTVTRDGSGNVNMYFNGATTDWNPFNQPNLGFPTGVMKFFDSEATAIPAYESGGSVYRIRIYDRVLDATEVSDAFATITIEN